MSFYFKIKQNIIIFEEELCFNEFVLQQGLNKAVVLLFPKTQDVNKA
jgi:hypothetical protein